MISINFNKIKPYCKFNINNCEFNINNPIEDIINAYYSYVDCNCFSDLTCPLCGFSGCLHYHKSYERNLIYLNDDKPVETKIIIAVLVCSHCKNIKAKQKYHALLPTFIFPYHIYESSLIIDSIYKRICQKIKLDEILNRIKITHKLFYDWIKKIKKYLLPSSVIVKTKNEIIIVINEIYKLNDKFLIDFYNSFKHHFFLFKLTCVPLCITP